MRWALSLKWQRRRHHLTFSGAGASADCEPTSLPKIGLGEKLCASGWEVGLAFGLSMMVELEAFAIVGARRTIPKRENDSKPSAVKAAPESKPGGGADGSGALAAGAGGAVGEAGGRIWSRRTGRPACGGGSGGGEGRGAGAKVFYGRNGADNEGNGKCTIGNADECVSGERCQASMSKRHCGCHWGE